MGSATMRTGLDYAAARAGWEMMGWQLTPDDFNGVRTMEMALLVPEGESDGD